MKFLTIALFASATLAAPSFQNISRGSTVLGRRGNSNGAGDSGGHVKDQSVNHALTAHGDSNFSGANNEATVITNTFADAAKNIVFRRGFLEGIGLIGANGNSNEDSSTNSNAIAGNNQQNSGLNIKNAPKAEIGATRNDFAVSS
jgi:hypothetical protein